MALKEPRYSRIRAAAGCQGTLYFPTSIEGTSELSPRRKRPRESAARFQEATAVTIGLRAKQTSPLVAICTRSVVWIAACAPRKASQATSASVTTSQPSASARRACAPISARGRFMSSASQTRNIV